MVANGKGNIKHDVNRVISIISGVFYVLKLKNNLSSLRQLQEKGMRDEHFILVRTCKIYHTNKGLIMKSNMSLNHIFILHVISLLVAHTYFNIIVKDVVQLWHLSFEDLQTLQQKGIVEDLPLLKSLSKLCKGCLVGKQHRDSFPTRSSWRASQILQLVHADIL